MNRTKTSSQLGKLLSSLDSIRTPLGSMLITTKSSAIKHLPGKENIIERVWKSSVLLYYLLLQSLKMKKLILSTHGSHLKNNWTTLLGKLSICNKDDLNTLPMYLLQTLLLELISKEKDYKPYWTPAYNELSEKLLLPTEIDYVGSDSNCLNPSLIKVEEKSSFLTTIPIKVQNKNSQKTYFQLSTSTVVNKWEKEVTPTEVIKVLKIKLKPSRNQKNILNEWIHTSNFVYNKTVEEINVRKHRADFKSLRDKFVTSKTKKNNKEYIELSNAIKELHKKKTSLKKIRYDFFTKKQTMKLGKLKQLEHDICRLQKEANEHNVNLRKIAKNLPSEKNEGIYEWELNTPKEVRAGAVNDVCKAIKTGLANLKAGNIRHFRLGFRKRTENYKSVVIPKSFLQNKYGTIQLAPQFLKDECNFKMGRKTIKKHKNLVIQYDSRIVKQMKHYWLLVPIPASVKEKTPPVNYCGIDPGVRTFMTSFGNNGCLEYKHNESKLKKIDAKIQKYTNMRFEKRTVRKQKLSKLERKKEYMIDELHWKTINHILKNNDFIFYGNIKSHDIVKNGKNRTLNKGINNLKFYKFKERLLFKATERGKKVYLVNEAYTTQTCSFCGHGYKVGCTTVYSCQQCRRNIGRDVNAAKNILMKGIESNL